MQPRPGGLLTGALSCFYEFDAAGQEQTLQILEGGAAPIAAVARLGLVLLCVLQSCFGQVYAGESLCQRDLFAAVVCCCKH